LTGQKGNGNSPERKRIQETGEVLGEGTRQWVAAATENNAGGAQNGGRKNSKKKKKNKLVAQVLLPDEGKEGRLVEKHKCSKKELATRREKELFANSEGTSCGTRGGSSLLPTTQWVRGLEPMWEKTEVCRYEREL